MLKPYQQRVIGEKKELDDKLTRLRSFLVSGDVSVPKEEKDRLSKQADIMDQYSQILGERIANFTGD